VGERGASQKGLRVCGGGRETSNVGTSIAGGEGERLGKQRVLTGGVHGPARKDSRTGGQH
jgi:hypothetical protein